MIPSLSLAFALASAVLAVLASSAAARGRAIGRRTRVAILVLEVALVSQATRDAVGLFAGHVPAEPATHWGYLVSSVVVLPIAFTVAQGDRGRWGSVAIAVGLFAMAVVVFRMQQTWTQAVPR